METPWTCRKCGTENWVDLERLSEWPVDGLMNAMGYVCESCGMREAISYTTTSLKEAERKLSRYQPGHSKYEYLFRKLVRKQDGLNARGELHGTSEHPNLAVP